jgi:rubredoxin
VQDAATDGASTPQAARREYEAAPSTTPPGLCKCTCAKVGRTCNICGLEHRPAPAAMPTPIACPNCGRQREEESRGIDRWDCNACGHIDWSGGRGAAPSTTETAAPHKKDDDHA